MTATTDTAGRVVVLDVVGLQPGHVDADRAPRLHSLLGANVTDLRPPFPAVTIPVQTTLASGQSPAAHGDVANGEYDRETDAVAFWERDREHRTRLWETASEEAGLTTGVCFFQRLLGTTADVAITPKPIEDEDNNLLEMHCWTNPDDLYDDLREAYGHFPLHNYWGPAAGVEGSEWILTAAREAVERHDPDLLWVYVPHLDYVGQREGPSSPAFDEELETVDALVGEFVEFLRGTDRWEETAVTVVSEYGFHDVDRAIFPNRALAEASLLETRADGDVDLPASAAFAMVDHQVAHVYADDEVLPEVAETLASLAGVERVLDEEGKATYGLTHPNAGDLVCVAESDAWFQYYWWDEREDAPPYATDVDIHAKPGFDPCELFLGEEGMASLDPTKVSGSHGRVDEEAYGCFGVGGPVAPAVDGDAVDALAVAPTITDLLGIEPAVGEDFEGESILSP